MVGEGQVIKYLSKPERSRRQGRPRARWLEVLEKDLREMQAWGWRLKAADREEWASEIKEARAPRGPESDEVNKL